MSHGGGESSYNARNANFDASRSATVYGESSTVQPSALMSLPCIKF